jgi:hypothetical protein
VSLRPNIKNKTKQKKPPKINKQTKKPQQSQINHLVMHFKVLEKQVKPKISRQKEIIKIRAEIDETETKKKNLYKESMKQKLSLRKDK